MHGRLADRSSMVAVAQLVESRIVIPVVVGSSPISHPSILTPLSRTHRFGASGRYRDTVNPRDARCHGLRHASPALTSTS